MEGSQEVIDIEGLRRMSGNDEAFVTEILQLYSERAARDLSDLERAQASSDVASAKFVVHRMRSAAVPLGLKQLVVALKKVELALQHQFSTEVSEQLTHIMALTEQAITDASNRLSLQKANQ